MIHLVFSTKNREPFIKSVIQNRLHGYIVGILGQMKCPSIQTGGVADHVHILFVLGRTTTQAEVVEEVKKSSSKWMKADGGVPNFSWQNGYGAFSVRESHREKVIDYIKNQEEHHRTITFQEEYRKLLEKYRIPFDEKYVWD
jgi:REP element-mobilizing transposase RayT